MEVDLVMPFPDSGNYAALGYAQASGLPLEMGVIRNHYVGRTFIQPSQSMRDFGVKVKLNPVKELLRNKRVLIIEDSIIFKSEVVARLLERCCMVAIFLVTIGSHLEDTASRLAEDGLVLQASVLEAIGSDAVERVADYVQEMTKEMARADGLVISNRFSPGYCDWEVSQQKVIFQAVSGDSIGVHLTEHCLMVPRKSISGIIGIGPSEGNVENYDPCTRCDKYDCPGRR